MADSQVVTLQSMARVLQAVELPVAPAFSRVYTGLAQARAGQGTYELDRGLYQVRQALDRMQAACDDLSRRLDSWESEVRGVLP